MVRRHKELDEVLARLSVHAREHASGTTLALWAAGDAWDLPPAATPVEYLGDLRSSPSGRSARFDSVVSVGQLGLADDLGSLLVELETLMAPGCTLHFCEPTTASDDLRDSLPNDVTTALWRGGYTVFRCSRERYRYRMRTHEFCWGRARITPDTSPPRRWASGDTEESGDPADPTGD